MKMPAMSRRTALAVAAMVIGIAVVLLALVGGSGSSGGGSTAESTNEAIEPVSPVNPNDDTRKPVKQNAKAVDPTNPFAASFGDKGARRVTVRIAGNGVVWAEVDYRGRKSAQHSVNGSFAQTRKVKGGSPVALVAIQLPPGALPGSASRATCRIIVDGVEISETSTSKAGDLVYCIG